MLKRGGLLYSRLKKRQDKENKQTVNYEQVNDGSEWMDQDGLIVINGWWIRTNRSLINGWIRINGWIKINDEH